MYKYFSVISYDGTFFAGWQKQPGAPTIQEELEKALFLLLKEKISVIGSGRTDSGAHAMGQTAHFSTNIALDTYAFLRSLNGILPYAIRVRSLDEVDEHFHVRFSAIKKEYHYHLWFEPYLCPFTAPYRHHIKGELDLFLFQEALQAFIGTHDFCSFANTHGSVLTTTRTIYRIECFRQLGGLRVEFEGNGFLYKMVRNIIGYALEVAKKKRSLEQLPEILAAKDRRAVGQAAPAKGLFLMRVFYPEDDEKDVLYRQREKFSFCGTPSFQVWPENLS